MWWYKPKKSQQFNFCHVTADNLSNGCGMKWSYFQKRPVKSTGNKSWPPKLRFIAQNKTETCTICLFDSQILFSERAGSVGGNALKHYLKRLWLVSIATILSKTFKIHFLFMSAIAHDWSFFTKFKKTFWCIQRVPFHLKKTSWKSPIQERSTLKVTVSTQSKIFHSCIYLINSEFGETCLYYVKVISLCWWHQFLCPLQAFA